MSSKGQDKTPIGIGVVKRRPHLIRRTSSLENHEFLPVHTTARCGHRQKLLSKTEPKNTCTLD